MDTLSREQRDVLLDYYFECAGQQETQTAQKLLAHNRGAVEFYEKLHHSLSPLDHLDHHTDIDCPDTLVEKTLERVYSHDHNHTTETANVAGLEKLLKAESEKVVTKQPSFWRHFVESAAIAAGVFAFFSIFVPVSRHLRAGSWQTACQANLAKISQGFTQYASDNRGYLPALTTKAGAPWWKVGSTSQENQSNTRHLWLLVRNGYLGPDVFICPGSGNTKTLKLDNVQIAALADFPGKKHISYSFKLICDANKAAMPRTATPLMSDANPIFQACFKNCDSLSRSEFDPVTLSEKLLNATSHNHFRKGQNILFSDGNIKFTNQRIFGQNDDIFTVRDTHTYRGTEKPTCETDVFLVP
ncbi:MAG: hypothetical protein PHP01_05295 [Phycisphaerae bacterium]|nr:hypothetical protein [Phycisphaerae bacterium]